MECCRLSSRATPAGLPTATRQHRLETLHSGREGVAGDKGMAVPGANLHTDRAILDQREDPKDTKKFGGQHVPKVAAR